MSKVVSVAIVAEQYAAGTADGGTFTLGARRTRVLNTIDSDLDSIVTLSSNQFTLGAGDYEIEWWAPAYDVSYHMSWLRNTTDGSDVASAMSTVANSGQDLASMSEGIAFISIGSSKTFEIQHESALTKTTTGFGGTQGMEQEQYTTVIIRKLGESTPTKPAFIADQKPSGTDSGDFAAGGIYRTRILNTVLTDLDGLVTLSSNQFTLGAGRYEVVAKAPSWSTRTNKLRLLDVGVPVVVATSVNETYNTQTRSDYTLLVGVLDLASSKTYELQHRCELTKTTNGFGLKNTKGTEQFAIVKIRKIS